MSDDCMMSKVKEMLRQYSFDDVERSDSEFPVVSERKEQYSETEVATEIIRSLKLCLSKIKVLKTKNTCIDKKKLCECSALVDEIKQEICEKKCLSNAKSLVLTAAIIATLAIGLRQLF